MVHFRSWSAKLQPTRGYGCLESPVLGYQGGTSIWWQEKGSEFRRNSLDPKTRMLVKNLKRGIRPHVVGGALDWIPFGSFGIIYFMLKCCIPLMLRYILILSNNLNQNCLLWEVWGWNPAMPGKPDQRIGPSMSEGALSGCSQIFREMCNQSL